MVSESTSTPEALVVAFVRDYFDWNNRAAATMKQPSDQAIGQRIQQEYQALLHEYCPPGFKGEPLSYGSHSSHHPSTTRIVATTVGATSTVVRTQIPMAWSSTSFHTHEFELLFRESRWFLTGIFYIDGQERLPSL
jgi:hypothetical protein